MSRIARVVIPGLPHHIVQRGNRRQRVFFCDGDREYYLNLLSKYGRLEGVSFLAYCLMENHVHLIAIPKTPEGLAACIGTAHWKYALAVNLREDWKGHLWQARFLSYPLDEEYLYRAMRYVELNPIRAKIVSKPDEYPWSSARAHILNKHDKIITENSYSLAINNWESFLINQTPEPERKLFMKHSLTGRPLGNEAFIEKLEQLTGRVLKERKRGPKPSQSIIISS